MIAKKKKSKMIEITQVKSEIGFPRKQRLVLVGLGLRKRGKIVVRLDTPEIRGMINKVIHLVEVKEL
ncbi:MAG: 50S ribosomal protein L30 [Candidatus Fischerbacteria bacterium RBG_13_37_8]|uniref:50S ribosomal protein L30 n=1 Tax=Candidatus Fischerbacteria bacterium RBG_13_37_8 TaxID=1817863 RepID=A0A1F5VDZ8_9BACT|nr:MAG: 50S ribosomal protein L30 [Candidatus Fischerbacteria bacterium RBG_13_37_8]